MKPKILIVDDEAHLVVALQRLLRAKFEVLTAPSGIDGLSLLAAESDVGVVVSDMRMPLMSGTEFLARSRFVAPNAVRLLLTGQTDMEEAEAAKRDGWLWAFVTKPCPPDALRRILDEAHALYRLKTKASGPF